MSGHDRAGSRVLHSGGSLQGWQKGQLRMMLALRNGTVLAVWSNMPRTPSRMHPPRKVLQVPDPQVPSIQSLSEPELMVWSRKQKRTIALIISLWKEKRKARVPSLPYAWQLAKEREVTVPYNRKSEILVGKRDDKLKYKEARKI